MAQPSVVRRILFFYPFTLGNNRYAELQIQMFATICDAISPVRPLALLKNCLSRRRTSVILNFFEDRTAYFKTKPNWTLAQNIALLLLLRVTCKRIIWVRHNFWPHDLPRGYVQHRLLLFFIGLLSTDTVTHRSVRGTQSIVVPHPLYFEGQLPDSHRDIDFLYFGAIRRYKGLDALLALWPADRRLIVAGAVPDAELLGELRRLVNLRSLAVEFVARYIPDSELDALLLRTKYVVQPHSEDSMIVSGTFYHAASWGANVLASQSAFSEYLHDTFDFVTVYAQDKLHEALARLHYVEPLRVVHQLREVNGSTACRTAWERLLER